jgi:hypothetical protein
MIVVACNATLYPKTCNNTLYFDSHTLGAMTQKLVVIVTSIALERVFDAMADEQALTSQVMHGVVRNASLISISHYVPRSWISWFSIFRTQKKPTLLHNMHFSFQAWFSATLRYHKDCYSPLCSSFPRPYHLRIGKA